MFRNRCRRVTRTCCSARRRTRSGRWPLMPMDTRRPAPFGDLRSTRSRRRPHFHRMAGGWRTRPATSGAGQAASGTAAYRATRQVFVVPFPATGAKLPGRCRRASVLVIEGRRVDSQQRACPEPSLFVQCRAARGIRPASAVRPGRPRRAQPSDVPAQRGLNARWRAHHWSWPTEVSLSDRSRQAVHRRVELVSRTAPARSAEIGSDRQDLFRAVRCDRRRPWRNGQRRRRPRVVARQARPRPRTIPARSRSGIEPRPLARDPSRVLRASRLRAAAAARV